MIWDGPTAAWWRAEVSEDPAYVRDVDALLAHLLPRPSQSPWLDLGCGDGRLLGASAHVGVDRSIDLVGSAVTGGKRAVVADVSALPFRSGTFVGAHAVLVFEHVADVRPVFAEAHRVVKPGGHLVVVINHPLYTAPGSGPFVDPDDGEVLWRWGSYLGAGSTLEPAGEAHIEFHHRAMGDLLSSAADSGWALDALEERSLDPAGDPLLSVQRDVPRVLGVRWRRTSS